MSDRIQGAIALARFFSRDRWAFYFDLFCMVAIGMSLRPALEPFLAVGRGTYALLTSDRCPIRALMRLLGDILSVPAPARAVGPAATRCGS